MKHAAYILVLVAVLTPMVLAQQNAYDLIERAYAPYMSADDPLGFPMKVRSLAADPYKFCGSKDLFFIWCKSNAADWLADSQAFVPNHGDLHLGNIGTYPREGAWSKLAFGMVDFDDTASLPFQLELLQGFVTLELTARQNAIELSEAQQQQLAKTLLETYRIAVNSQRNATDLLLDGGDTAVAGMLERQSVGYQVKLDELTESGRFRNAVYSAGTQKPKELLSPAMSIADDLAIGISAAIANEPDLKKLFRYTDPDDIRSQIKDAARRTRMGSSGSQGLKKYFVLLDRPLRGVDHDVIVYLKRQIPSAAERAGVVPPAQIDPGQRVKENMDRLTSPLPYINSWCRIGDESYWFSFAEPWSDELDPGGIESLEELMHTARVWATVAGATHREEGRFNSILPRLTPALAPQLLQRSAAFVKQLNQDFDAFRADPRTKAQLEASEAAIASTLPR